MKRMLPVLLVFGMSLSICFAEFIPGEARRVFGESSSSIASSGTIVGDYLFVGIEWKESASLATEEREALEMSAVMEAMRRFIAPQPVVCTNSPFCATLTGWLSPDVEFVVPNVKRSIVKDESNGEVRRQVLAFEAQPMKEARMEMQKKAPDLNKWTEARWAEQLKNVKLQFKTRDDRRKFYTLLGCPVVNLVHDKGGGDYGLCLPGCEKAWDELERIAKWRPIEGSFFAEYGNLLWSGYARDHAGVFYPAWTEDDGGRFIEAEKLYRKGKDIGRIINLLAESISVNPINNKKWEYLGGVLKASNKPEDAAIAYIQALKINPKNVWAWKGLADSCEKAGFVENAKGIRWYLKIMD